MRPPGGIINIWKRDRLHKVSTHPPFSQIHLWPSAKVISFTLLPKESLVSHFQKDFYSSRLAETEGMNWEYRLLLRSTILWIVEPLSPQNFKIIYLCWLLNSHKASLFSPGSKEDWDTVHERVECQNFDQNQNNTGFSQNVGNRGAGKHTLPW